MTIRARPRVPGDPILARDWDDIIRRVGEIEKRFGGAGASTQFEASVAVVMFSYLDTDGDVIIANSVDAQVDPAVIHVSSLYYIAKPERHRPSILTRGGHTYVYTTDFERTDTLGGNAETQVLTPDYVAGDFLYAMRVSNMTGVFYDPLGGAALAPVEWIQVNVDGRAWAQKFGT